MKNFASVRQGSVFLPGALIAIAEILALCALVTTGASAQDANPPLSPKAAKGGYDLRQTYDIGGHFANVNGSGAMYDTMVNLQSGPRLLDQTIEAHTLPGTKFALFDTLFESSAGYGGDPNAFSSLRMSKGKLYDFTGLFRRDRQYFDYDLLGNPLVPGGAAAPVSNGYAFPQVEYAPHLFNTVRRMTDANLTLLPLSRVSFRAGYSQNIMQGPTYSSIHEGTEALLLQSWRNSTDSWLGAVDWKPMRGTTFTYEQHIVHFKGNTSDILANQGLLQLAGGVPVSLGFDNVTAPAATGKTSPCGANPAILNSATTPPTANPCVNGFLSYSRFQATRTLFPTEEFRFQSSSLKNVQMTGRALYTSGNTNLPVYDEIFNGLVTRTSARAVTSSGFASARRIDTAANYGIVWQMAPRFSVSEQFDFLDWRQPGIGLLSAITQTGSSMAVSPGAPGVPVVTSPDNFLGQKSESNAIVGAWDATGWARISLGWHYRFRNLGYILSVPTDALATGRNYTYNDHTNSALLNVVLRPNAQWRVNGSVETGWADNVYVAVAPRQFQQYQIRATYRPKDWATFSGAYNDLERRDSHVALLAHSRSFAAAADAAPNERYSFDLSYGYMDAFSTVRSCFVDTLGSQPADATAMPIGVACGNAVNSATGTSAFFGTSYYDAPAQYGAASLVLTPVKQFQSAFGYRVTALDGNTEMLNPRDVPGVLQSKYQTPYVNLMWKAKPGWALRGEWSYYGYGESASAGPTAPRNFHGNVATIGLHYEH
jgi:hypothetical protein